MAVLNFFSENSCFERLLFEPDNFRWAQLSPKGSIDVLAGVDQIAVPQHLKMDYIHRIIRSLELADARYECNLSTV